MLTEHENYILDNPHDIDYKTNLLFSDSIEVVRLGLMSGGDVEWMNHLGENCLLHHSRLNNTEIVKLLSGRVVCMTSTIYPENNVMHCSIVNRNSELLKLFSDNEELKLQKNSWGMTPLHLAVKMGHLEEVKLTYSKEAANIENDGRTALDMARSCGGVIERFLENNLTLLDEIRTTSEKLNELIKRLEETSN